MKNVGSAVGAIDIRFWSIYPQLDWGARMTEKEHGFLPEPVLSEVEWVGMPTR